MAAHSVSWVDGLLPRIRMRQYVLSLPIPLRFLLARRGKLQGVVLSIFIHVVFEYLRRKAFELGICDHGDEAKPGSISVIQRFGSALNLNIHFRAPGKAWCSQLVKDQPRQELAHSPGIECWAYGGNDMS